MPLRLRKQLSAEKLSAIKKADCNIELFAHNRARHISDTETVAAIIRNPQKRVIVAVWGDDSEPDYCGYLVIRGQVSSSEDLDSDDGDAIHCTCIEHAMAMRKVFGDEAEQG
jgi:hypothetical protein